MLWWIATIVVWLISAIGILYVMADVFRGKARVVGAQTIGAVGFHGVTAILVLFLLFKALGSGWPVKPQSS